MFFHWCFLLYTSNDFLDVLLDTFVIGYHLRYLRIANMILIAPYECVKLNRGENKEHQSDVPRC